MAESGFAGSSYGSAIAPASSVTYYGNYGCSASAALTVETTEANAQLVHRGVDAVVKNLRVVVTTNGRAAASSVTTRKNGADTSQVANITASTTGTYTDLTNTVSLTAGDTASYKLIVGSTAGNFNAPSITVNRESTGQAANFWSSTGSISTTTASVTRYWNLAGAIGTAQSTESSAQAYAPAAGTISNLRVYVTAARLMATTFKSRVAGADGTMSVSITGTGAFEDTTNSDTVSAGSLICAATVTDIGVDTLTISCISIKYTPSTAGVTAISAGATSTTLAAAATRYYNVLGNFVGATTESAAQQIAPFGGTAAYLCSTVTANASTTTSTIVLRKAGADTAVTYTIAGAATGSFVDTTNSVSVSAGDLLSIKGSGSDGTVTFRAMGLRFTAPTAAVYNQSCLAATTPVSAIVRQTGKPLQAGTTALAALVRQAGKLARATTTPVSGLVRQTGKLARATTTPASSLIRQTAKILLASTTALAALVTQTAGTIYNQLCLAATTPVSRLTRQTGKLARATTTPVSRLVRSIGKLALATTTPVISLTRQTAKALLVNNAIVASLTKQTAKSFQAVNAIVASCTATLGSAAQVIVDFIVSVFSDNRTGRPGR